MSIRTRLSQFAQSIRDSFLGGEFASIKLSENNRNQFSPVEVPPAFRRAEDTFLRISLARSLGQSTYLGTDRPSPKIDEWQREFIEPEARKALFRQIEQLVTDDPMLSAGLTKLGDFVAGKPPKRVYKTPEDQMNPRQITGRDALELSTKLCAGKDAVWAKELFEFGDLYQQIVASNADVLTAIKSMHVATMERLSDHTDEFPDPNRAYRQRDTVNREIEAYFSDFQIVHSRWDKGTGDRYGRSMIFPSRQCSQDSVKGYAELIIRRFRSLPISTYEFKDGDNHPLMGKALQRAVYGEQGKPSTALPEIRAQQGDLEAMLTPFAYRAVNGGSYKIDSPDVKLGQVDDLNALTDRALAVLGYARALINGDVANYATAGALLEIFYELVSRLQGKYELIAIRPRDERVLLLYGILPEELEYEYEWATSYTTEKTKFICDTTLKMHQQGLLNPDTANEIILPHLGRKDIEVILEKNKIARATGLMNNPNKAQETGAGSAQPSGNGNDQLTEKKNKGIAWTEHELDQLSAVSEQDLEDSDNDQYTQ